MEPDVQDQSSVQNDEAEQIMAVSAKRQEMVSWKCWKCWVLAMSSDSKTDRSIFQDIGPGL